MTVRHGALETPAATPAVPSRFAFVTSLDGVAAPARVIDLAAFRDGAPPAHARGIEPVDLASVFAAHGEAWKERFAQWLGRLNAKNASLEWWAHASTAKNFLSSTLGNSALEVFAVLHAAPDAGVPLYVIGASATQRSAIEIGAGVRAAVATDAVPLRARLRAALRVIAQVGRAFGAFFARGRTRAVSRADVCAITYADRPLTGNEDFYFGALHRHLDAHGRRLEYAAYVYTPYRERLAELRGRREYDALFHHLTLGDWLWAARRALVAAFQPLVAPDDAEAGLALLLEEAFVDDVAARGYVFHLLAYAATKRLIRARQPSVLLYPYENKSLEKMVLLAARHADPQLKIVAYQHTSVTPRHATLLFAKGEAAATPLPDRIVTVGELTRDYLAAFGGYPAGIFVAGCALRQAHAPLASRRLASRGGVRVLLALSSSRAELAAGVRFAAGLKSQMPRAEIAVRTHPNFPATLLPEDLRRWLDAHASDVSQTPLPENLEWCDVTLYASSTVALETLMRGKPVLRFDAGEILSGDPLFLGEPRFRFIAAGPAEGAATLERLTAMGDDEYHRLSHEAVAYALSYLRPYEERHLALFLAGDAQPHRAEARAAVA